MHILRTLRVFYSEREMLECISFGHRSCAGASKRPVSYTECATPFFLLSHRDVFLQYRPRGTPLQPHRSAVSRPRLRRRCSPLGCAAAHCGAANLLHTCHPSHYVRKAHSRHVRTKNGVVASHITESSKTCGWTRIRLVYTEDV
jgi:hypothetical protein